MNLDDFAVRSFRDIGDGDYIAARMACRAQMVTQFLWSSQQAIEKYLKCILLLNRIKASKVWKISLLQPMGIIFYVAVGR